MRNTGNLTCLIVNSLAVFGEHFAFSLNDVLCLLCPISNQLIWLKIRLRLDSRI